MASYQQGSFGSVKKTTAAKTAYKSPYEQERKKSDYLLQQALHDIPAPVSSTAGAARPSPYAAERRRSDAALNAREEIKQAERVDSAAAYEQNSLRETRLREERRKALAIAEKPVYTENNGLIQELWPSWAKATGNSGYQRDKAVAYARQYAERSNPEYPDFSNPFFSLDYKLTQGAWPGLGDCANFVSQSLAAGGLEMNDTWHYEYSPYEGYANDVSPVPLYLDPEGNKTLASGAYDFTAPWVRASDLFLYFGDPENGYSTGLLSFSGNKYKVEKDLREASSQIRPGDLLFWDTNQDGEYTHATIIVGFTEDGIPTFAGHSVVRNDKPITDKDLWREPHQDIAIVQMRE